MDISYLVIFIDAPLFVFIVINYFKLTRVAGINNKAISLLKLVSFPTIFFLLLLLCRVKDIRADITARFTGETTIISKYGLFVNDALDLLLNRDRGMSVKGFKYGKKVIFKKNTDGEHYNVICIQLEAVDANIIHFKYKGKHITPFLHRLSSQSIYYPYMLVYINAGNTSDVEFAAINSVIPLNNIPSMELEEYDYSNSFVKRLSQSNFKSLAFHNNVGSFFNRDRSFLRAGFHRFHDLKNMQLEEIGWGAADHDVMNYVKNKLKKQNAPFFYYIITMSTHAFYDYVERYFIDARYNDINDETVKNYFNSMSYLDKVLEDFVLYVKDNVKNTYIFIFGDHPPHHPKEAALLQKSDPQNPYKPKERPLLYRRSAIHRNLLYTPLFIITPDNKQYIETERVAGVLDLAPTILYASGISCEIKTSGINLLDFKNKEDLIPVSNKEMLNRKDQYKQLIELNESNKHIRLN